MSTARYDITSRYSVDDNNQTASRKPKVSSSFVMHRVRSGDTLEILAAQQLGNTQRWWEIADINPHLKFPADLVIGELIRLPAS